jgi:SAM-dependent methyltransferase
MANDHGTTGYSDRWVYAFDQLMRIRCIERVLREFVDVRLWPDLTLLDFGCGRGDFLERFCGFFKQSVGYDWSDRIIRLAANRLTGRPNVTFLDALDRLQGSFDVVLAVTVLQHILSDEELLRILRTVSGVCAPEAILIALESREGSGWPVNFPPHVHARTMDEWKRFLGEAGWIFCKDYSFYNPYLIPTKSYEEYRRTTRWTRSVYRVLKKMHVDADWIGTRFERQAARILERGVDGIIASDSFSKIMVFRKGPA